MKIQISDLKIKPLLDKLRTWCDQGQLEKRNYEVLTSMIAKCENYDDAISLLEIATQSRITGLFYRHQFEKVDSKLIHYFKEDPNMSFGKNGVINKLIIGDNYYALQNLLISYRKSIDLIYIDPPYGCNDMGDFASVNYENNISRDNLLSQLHPRLELAQQLLSNNGTIFVSIDDKNQAYVKCLMDQIFGENKFVTCIPRVTKFQRAGQETYMDISHDYILCYTNADDFENIIDRDYSEVEIKEDNIGKYIVGDTKAILAAASQGYSKGGDYDFEYKGKIYKPEDKNGIRNRWLWTKERMTAAAKLGILVPTKNSLRVQLYIDKKFDESTNTMVPKDEKLIFHTADFMQKSEYANANGVKDLSQISIKLAKIFSNPKPVALVKKLISFYKDKNIKILDFYAGSGTTGQAVLEMNKEDGGKRSFILCTNNDKLDNKLSIGVGTEVTYERLKRIMTGKCSDMKDFPWVKNHKIFGNTLKVIKIAEMENTNKKIFDEIDPKIYDYDPQTLKKKIEWVCKNFEQTQTILKEEDK